MFVLFGILMIFKGAAVEGNGVSGELYSSLTHMNDLFVFDRKVAEILSFLPTYLLEVASYKESYSRLIHDVVTLARGNALNEGDFLDVAITGNPLHLFAVIKRLVLYWPPIRRSIITIFSSEGNCINKNELCEWWAKSSECSKNPAFMMVNCQLSCGLCGKTEQRAKLLALLELEERTVLPSLNDLRGASLALARLQQIYRIPIPNLATGTIANVTTSVVLSVYDCIRIANESHYEGQYVNAWQWYNYAGAIATTPDMKGLIDDLKAPVAEEHDEKHSSHDPKFFPHPISRHPLQVPRDTEYFSLCRGNSLLTNETAVNLKCYISSRGSPYLILRPIKVEHVHHDPEMYVFYDVISDKEGQAIKDRAKSQLARSGVLSHTGAVELRVSQTAWLGNTSHSYFPTIAKRISAITGLLVFEDEGGLYAGEPLQVLSYGIGGHYTYHTDPLWKYDLLKTYVNAIRSKTYIHMQTVEERTVCEKYTISELIDGTCKGSPRKGWKNDVNLCKVETNGAVCIDLRLISSILFSFQWENHREKFRDFESGDRLATWIFYLSDVEAGGRTAFPKAGVSVTPVKGSAAFWFNLLRNGKLNPRSEHGGCPVLLGHKWVANKWIRENFNFMREPCTLDEFE
ncbi:prolyl 4-hydroxylase subunit alpha-1-like [Macrobrachium rosenbergii]|uniref:prolyl 4-hydroxylase subunit alpha-1-like n=1 Tax=Macrobrachium rosenbergii TaxID=79674 RepID=UPI0034D69C7D